MAYRSAAQVRNMHRVETLIRLASPALDLVLYAGEKASKVVGRNQIGPESPPRPGLPPDTRH